MICGHLLGQLTSWLSLRRLTVSLSLSHWYPGSDVVVLILSIPDICTLTYFTLCMHYELSQYYSVTAEIDVPFTY